MAGSAVPVRPSGARRWRPVLAVIVLLGCLAGCAGPVAAPGPPVPAPSTAEPTRADVDAWLDGLVPAALQRSRIAGAAVAVVHDGRMLTSRGYGTGSAGGPPRPVDPEETLFRAASVSKVFTATAVLQLAEQGRLDLDADVRRYLDFPLPVRFEEAITLRHLLTHTAGFEERVRGLIEPGDASEDLRAGWAVDPPEQVFAPGTTPAYSNYGYGLAGYVVQRISGMPYAEYVQRHVLDRAGMASSTLAQPLPAGLRDRLSAGYLTADDPAAPVESVRPGPAGALTTSVVDMARFIENLLGTGSTAPVLEQATWEQMQRPGLGAVDGLGALADGPRMTLGLFDESRNGRSILGHGGDTDLFHSHLQLYPGERAGIFVTLNSTGRTATESLELREAILNGFADRYFPATSVARADTGPGPTAVAHAPMMAGAYEAARAPFSTFLSAIALAGQTTITARPDGSLLVSPDPATGRPGAYREVRPWVWQEIGGQRILTTRTDGERVTAVGFGAAYTLLPVPPWRDASVVLPLLTAALLVLLGAVLARPLGAAVRRRHGLAAPVPGSRVEGLASTGTALGAGAAVLALVGWCGVVLAIVGRAEVASGVLVALIGLQVLGVLGLVPATAGVVTAVRHRAAAGRLVGRLAVTLSLAAVAVLAWEYGLLTPDLSY